MSYIKTPNFNRGVSLYLSIIIMTVLLAIALGISTVLLGQIELTRGIENSVVALYAADTGIERTLYAIRKQGYMPVVGNPCAVIFNCLPLSNQASYLIEIKSISPVEIDSRGSFGGTNRAIQISY